MSVHTCPGTEQFLNPTLPLNNRLSDARIVPVHTHSGTELFRNPTLSLDNQLSEAIEIHNMLVSSIRNVKGFYSETHHRLHYCYSFLRKLESTRSQVDSDEYNYRRNYNIRKRGRLGVEMHHLRKRWTRLLEKVKDAKQRIYHLEKLVAAQRMRKTVKEIEEGLEKGTEEGLEDGTEEGAEEGTVAKTEK